LCDAYNLRPNFGDSIQDFNGVLFAHIDLRYLMNSTLEGSAKGKTSIFNLTPLEPLREPIEFDSSIKCSKTQLAHDHSKHSTNVVL
jgi:hypothetical protein